MSRLTATFSTVTLVLTTCRSLPASPTPVARPVAETSLTARPVNPASVDCGDPFPAERHFGIPQWPDTNFCLHSVPYEEIVGAGPGRDGIPAIDEPQFETVPQADMWLADREPVIVFEHAGDGRAYPLQILIWHEIVNDVIGGQPVAITYCPLCNSAMVFDRVVAGQALDFGTSGNLRNSDLIMYDRQTASWWQQFTGEAIVGDLTGARLTLLPSTLVGWSEFKAQFPQGRVLSPDTGHELPYGENPYFGYDSTTNPVPSALIGPPDTRLHPKERVAALELNGVAIAYPFSALARQGAVNDTVAGEPIVVLWKGGAVSAVYGHVIAENKKEVGSTAVFRREVDGQVLTFAAAAGGFRDQETGSAWNIFGVAIAGPLTGTRLEKLISHEHFWFAWAAFQPNTAICGEAER